MINTVLRLLMDYRFLCKLLIAPQLEFSKVPSCFFSVFGVFSSDKV
jgi:hypothetical protein